METEIYTRKMRVCNQCNTAYWHPLNYCQRCPGRIVTIIREISGPIEITERRTYYDVKNYDKWLAENGPDLKDGGI